MLAYTLTSWAALWNCVGYVVVAPKYRPKISPIEFLNSGFQNGYLSISRPPNFGSWVFATKQLNRKKKQKVIIENQNDLTNLHDI